MDVQTDADRRLRIIEVTLGHRPLRTGSWQLIALETRRLVDDDVDSARISYTQNADGARVLVLDGQPLPRGVAVVNGEKCFLSGGPQRDDVNGAVVSTPDIARMEDISAMMQRAVQDALAQARDENAVQRQADIQAAVQAAIAAQKDPSAPVPPAPTPVQR